MRPARILLISAVAALVGLFASAAEAQVPDRQGFFGSVDGRWMWLGGDPVTTSQGSASQTGSGPGGQLMLGYKISKYWDIALAGDVQGLMTQLTKMQNGIITVDSYHQHFDLEAGYSGDWWRLNAGLRGIHYNQVIGYNLIGFQGSDWREIYGIGPKVGAGARWGVSDNWAVVGGADAALLFATYNDIGNSLFPSSGSSSSGLIPQVDVELGLNWRSSDNPLFSMTVGGRVTTSFNTSITADGNRRGTMVEYGPFVRVAYNFAGPTRVQALTADMSDAPPPVQSAPGTYVVFFDFDSTDLSPVALGLIRRAAADAQNDRQATIRVTSHAERAGSVDDKHALGLRRAQAVSAELARLGVPADQKVRIVF